MFSRLRRSFALKLMAAMLALAVALIGGIFAYLVVSRDQQTSGAALSNADNRAAVLAQVVVNFTGGQSLSAAQSLAGQPALVAALRAGDAGEQARALFARSSPVDLSGEIVMVTDATGTVVFRHAPPDAGSVRMPDTLSAAMKAALRGNAHCVLPAPAGTACGIELLGNSPAYDVAVPVVGGGRIVGVVAYLAPLQSQLGRYNALLDYPVAIVDRSQSGSIVRFGGGDPVASSLPDVLQPFFQAGGSGSTRGIYASPSGEQVAGSFVPVDGPDGKVAAWVGVEAPLSQFVGDTKTDEVTLGLIALLAILVTILLVVVFVARVVWRPIARLERGVARIAAGDYTSPVPVSSHDELGRLAESVNTMQARINDYVSEIERSRSRLDSAVDRMSDLSRALTGTASGVSALEQDVVATAAAIGGEGCGAWMALRDNDLLVIAASHHGAQGETSQKLSEETTAALLRGEVVDAVGDGGETSLLAVPMFSHGAVVGALGVSGPTDLKLGGERDVLGVLANNAAIARDNARLFEQERETVQRLRELDAMKTDFLGTVQHELRTPLTAILGLSDLIEMCWEMWDDPPKLEAVRDIQVAAKNLYDIVETIIDFSAMEGENLGLNPESLAVKPAVDEALASVAERYKGGIAVPVDMEIADDVEVYADRDRFDQVLRALVDNAVKFSDGKGRVTIKAERRLKRRILIVISDGGIGIPADEIPRVFERFHQVDNSATRRFGGTGMGLALVKRLVTAHGARVYLESRPGEGTTVSVDWPAVAEASGGEARRVAEERGDVVRHQKAPRREAMPVQ